MIAQLNLLSYKMYFKVLYEHILFILNKYSLDEVYFWSYASGIVTKAQGWLAE